jgi:regulator of protease activity HflC (stomatin/prohibitin superfamily)
MDRADHGRPDTPVTPSKRKPKADVEAARKSAEAVSRHTGAESRAKRKAEAVAEAVASPADVTSLDRVASLEAKIEQLTNTLAVLMDDTSHHTANEVSFSDLPFDPTSTL